MGKLPENRGIIRRYAEEWMVFLDEISGAFGSCGAGGVGDARDDVVV